MLRRLPSEAERTAPHDEGLVAVDFSNPLGLVPTVAWLGFLATLLGKNVVPAAYGLGTGLDAFLDRADIGADFLTFFFAALALATTSLQLVHTARDGRLTLAYRVTSIAAGALVVALVTPALPIRLPDIGLWMTATASIVVAGVAANQALRAAPTRALGLVLSGLTVAAALHLAALQLANSPLTKTLLLSRGLATASMVLDGLALAVAFIWLSSRSKGRTNLSLLIALSLASTVFWLARQGGHAAETAAVVLARRVVTDLSWGPSSFFVPEVRQLLELASLALAGAALFVRTGANAIAAPLALVLVARPTVDVPLSATALTLAALTAALRAAGERGFPVSRPAPSAAPSRP